MDTDERRERARNSLNAIALMLLLPHSTPNRSFLAPRGYRKRKRTICVARNTRNV